MISTLQIETSARKYWVKIWPLKCKVLNYVYQYKRVKATDLDKAFLFSTGRRTNELKHRWLLEVVDSEPTIGWAGERFFYALTDLGKKIMTDASMQTLANNEKLWNSTQQNNPVHSDHLQVSKIQSNHSQSETSLYQSNEKKESDHPIKTDSIGESYSQSSQKQDTPLKSCTNFLKRCFSRKQNGSQN